MIIVERSIVLGTPHHCSIAVEGDTVELGNIVPSIGYKPSGAVIIGNAYSSITTCVETVVGIPFHFMIVRVNINRRLRGY